MTYVEVLTPNKRELNLITGETDIEEGIKKLRGWGSAQFGHYPGAQWGQGHIWRS